ncbi:MAG TPA: tetratricopeptide repeat protein [Pirellulales bacterium]|nr:tetratricopeptide repeat protein [Pirellulales bacterium]
MTHPVTPSNLLLRRDLLLCTAIFIATLGSYWPVTGFGFLVHDDSHYVSGNPRVSTGLSPANVLWAVASTDSQNWHPLTWLSLQLDASLGGANPRMFHLSNVLLHAVGSVLLYVALRSLTGAVYRSALVAALFALHPLRVESVAWIAERKDVLSGCLWMLTLIAYGYYARRPGPGRYVLVFGSLALGLAAKSMLVTLPCVLLLLDFWPMRRFRFCPAAVDGQPAFSPASWQRLVLEKTPLFALSGLASFLTFYAQQHGGAMANAVARLPLGVRCANALVAYLTYLGKMFWPVQLAAFYPHGGQQAASWEAAIAAAGLLAVTVASFAAARRSPHLLVGWLWYLGTLVPVIGLVQVGEQSMADRYTYIPLIGISIALVWQAEMFVRWMRWPSALTAGMSAACLAACMVASRQQLPYWRDDISLWRRAVEVTGDNYRAEARLAPLLLAAGDVAGGEAHARKSIRLRPNSVALLVLGNIELRRGNLSAAESHYRETLRLALTAFDVAEASNGLGAICAMRGDYDAAFRRFIEATEANPDDALAYNNAGLALFKQRKFDEAQGWFSKSLACDPDFAEAFANLGDVLFYAEKWQQAKENYRRAALIQPRDPQLRRKLAAALWELKEIDEARRQYRFASEMEPGWPERAIARAQQFASESEPSEALPEKSVQLAKQACEATDPRTPHRFLDVLAAAYANAGRFDRAATMALRALSIAERDGNADEAAEIRERLAAYQAQSLPAAKGR